jgi:hypothetical protein
MCPYEYLCVPIDHTSPKHQQIVKAMQTHKFNALGLLETSLNGLRLGPIQQWRYGFPGLGDVVMTMTSNKHATTLSNHNYGGVAMIMGSFMANHFLSSGDDERGLGRWIWFTFRGKNKVMLRHLPRGHENPR